MTHPMVKIGNGSGDGLDPALIRTDDAQPRSYKLTAVEKIDAPEGGQGLDWYRYVIENGRSTITGHRRGLRDDVTAYATQFADQLNARGLVVRSAWTTRSKKRPG